MYNRLIFIFSYAIKKWWVWGLYVPLRQCQQPPSLLNGVFYWVKMENTFGCFFERELECFIWANIDNLDYLRSLGLEMPYGTYYRQLNIGEAGICDIVCFTKTIENGEKILNVHVIELKKDKGKEKDLVQLSRYVWSFMTDTYIKDMFCVDRITVSGALICNRVGEDVSSFVSMVNFKLNIFSVLWGDGINPRFINAKVGRIFWKSDMQMSSVFDAINADFESYDYGIFDEHKPVIIDNSEIPF